MNDFLIVVIGGSSGGLAPSIDLLRRIPKDLQAALFVVVHRSRPHALDRFVRERIGLPTHLARDLEPIEPGHVYICPADEYLSLENGVMRVEQSPREGVHRPSINALFRSAAQSYGRRVVGVLLSGGLYDGSAGLWQIKKHGGVTIVQDPIEAEHPSMPKTAISDVAVDYVLPAVQIGEKVAELAASQATGASSSAPRILIIEDESVVATNLQQALTELGYRVIDWVPTGEAGIELATRDKPDLILMDIHLAGALNGIETARTIWQSLQIPTVYCTAHGDLETIKAVQTTENYGYILKPFQAIAVRAAIELALARREKELRQAAPLI